MPSAGTLPTLMGELGSFKSLSTVDDEDEDDEEDEEEDDDEEEGLA